MTDEQRQHAVAAIQQALPALEWTLQPAKIKRLSRDFHWFSPVLTEQLAGKQADAVVRPRDEEELRQLVCACAQHQLPLTLRGSATGNYGQLVPLEGGLLVDMTGLNQIVALGNGTVRAQAGIRLADIETAARPTGWELRCMPSTYRLASLGGLYGGGFGGIGSIPGAVVGAFLIGICESVIKGSDWSVFSDAFTFAILIVVLCVKPTGLFGEKVTDKV